MTPIHRRLFLVAAGICLCSLAEPVAAKCRRRRRCWLRRRFSPRSRCAPPMRVANCEGAVCVKSSVIQVLGDQGLCLYEVYRADECLGNSESKKVSYEGDCNLPGGEGCHDCETCTVPGIEEAIKLPVEFSSTPLGRRHHAKSELIDNGTAGDAVIEHEKPVGLPIEEDIIEIPGGRHAKLLWITLGPNDFIGIGYETDDNAVTIPEANVDLEPLNVGVGLHRSYSIVAAKQGENRHYVAFMR